MKLRTKFEDEDFKLGEVVDAGFLNDVSGIVVKAEGKRGGIHTFYYSTLKEFADDWEDAPEEPKGSALDLMVLTLINFIENEPDEDKVDLEDCKQMLEKLKALKRLKHKGFKFDGWKRDERYYGDFIITASDEISCDDKDLDLLFGGEE